MGDQIVYLEKYVESTTTLPGELTRILTTIKDLDERSDDLAGQIQENVELVLQKAVTPAARRGGPDDEVAELRRRIEADQRLLIQFAEEKVQLGVQGYDLLDAHGAQLDLDIRDLTEELAERAQMMGMGDPMAEYSAGAYEEPPPKRSGSRMREAPSYASLEAPSAMDVKPPPPPRRTTITLSLSRQTSALDAEGAATPGMEGLQGVRQHVASALRKPPPPPSSAGPSTISLGPATGGSEPASVYHTKRRAAQAAVHAAAAAVAAMEADEYGEEGSIGRGGGAPPGAAAAAAAAAAGALGVGGPGAQHPHGTPHGRTPAEVAMQYASNEPLVPGLNHAAEQPQAPGRLLTYADISEALAGRKAELYWPDDNLWYLIQIQGVDVTTRRAQILYTTGEAETLSLDDIVREGHLSLITAPV